MYGYYTPHQRPMDCLCGCRRDVGRQPSHGMATFRRPADPRTNQIRRKKPTVEGICADRIPGWPCGKKLNTLPVPGQRVAGHVGA